MRVAMVSKALVVGAYQRKAEELAQLGVDLTVFIPPAWGDRRGSQVAEHSHTVGYRLQVIPLRFNGNFHLHYYPTLADELRTLRPDLLHMDEEPYNLATWLALRTAAQLQAPATFFTWQNLLRRYPPPFDWMERENYARTSIAIAGSQDAAGVLRSKGYAGEIAVIPQFGVDPQMFCPPAPERVRTGATGGEPFHVGYAGGLVREKGVDLLLRACAGLTIPWRLLIAGEGEERSSLEALAQELGVGGWVTFLGRQSSREMRAFYHMLDVFVLPSRTLPNWQEQFGRVLIEAMACAVPVVGSSSGEIPHVIGDGGLVSPEDDAAALRGHLQRLAEDADERASLGERGRCRVLAHYTMRQVAAQTLSVYQRLLERP